MNALEYLEMLLWGLILLALAATYFAGLMIQEILRQRTYTKMVETLPPATLQHECDADGVKLEDTPGKHEPQTGAGSHWRAVFRCKANALSERIVSADRLSPNNIIKGKATLPLLELSNQHSVNRPALAGDGTEQTV